LEPSIDGSDDIGGIGFPDEGFVFVGVVLGIATLGAAFSSGFVVCGSLSRGSTVLRTGGKSQVVSLVNAG